MTHEPQSFGAQHSEALRTAVRSAVTPKDSVWHTICPGGEGYTYEDIARSFGTRQVTTASLSELHSTHIQVYTPKTVGGMLAWRVMIAERQLTEVLPGLACANAIPDSLARRATIARHAIPSGYVLVGTGALWVLHGGSPPPLLDVAYNRFQRRPANRRIRSVRGDYYPKDLLTLCGITMIRCPDTARLDDSAQTSGSRQIRGSGQTHASAQTRATSESSSDTGPCMCSQFLLNDAHRTSVGVD